VLNVKLICVGKMRERFYIDAFEEYRKRLEKDSALERRFQPIVVNEPNEEQTIRILTPRQ